MVFQINVPVAEAANPSETVTRSYYKNPKGEFLEQPVGMKCSTVFEFIKECVELNGKDTKCQGWRELVDLHFEKKKVKKIINGQIEEVEKEWIYYELSDYKYCTFGDLQDDVLNLGRGLRSIGIEPNQRERFHIFGSTSPRWFRTFLACQAHSIPVATAYDNLGIDGITHSIVQTGSVGIFTDTNLLGKLPVPLKSATTIRYVIYSEKIDPNDKRGGGRPAKEALEAIQQIKEARPDIKLYSYEEVIQLGKESKDIEPNPPKPDDLCLIMYTSGSTGTPKGVELTHRNIVAGVAGPSLILDSNGIKKDDRFIFYLPLAHIFEIIVEMMCMYWGAIGGYASVKTLSDGSCRNCVGDLKTFKPTIMVGVTTMFENLKKGILSQISKLPTLSQKAFWSAYYAKTTLSKFHVPLIPSVIESLVFSKIKQATGGNLRIMMNGGSALSTETQIFLTEVLGAKLLLSMGTTETCGNGFVQDPEHFKYGTLGSVVGGLRMKLIDVPEFGYFAKNNQGEILIQTAALTPRYYKNEEETKSAIDSDRWLHTGDVGEWQADGGVRIIDRIKNLVKTQNGEYVALEKLESIYKSNSVVSNLCCYADVYQSRPIAIVSPVQAIVKQMAVDLGIVSNINEIQMADLLEKKELCDAITKTIVETGKSHGLRPFELIAGVVLVDDEWTPESGFVTTAHKLRRNVIVASVKSRIDELYKRCQ
ncbi:unnamed protein product [Ambrosiozyma monospora]|uniref:Unnamed protein product n=1 Tax=Ambrosiozyma monospora TaxID=43982 RepID=A0ACB5SXD2_AMBMO|nr:unnamed protein product [Ambrosiozyma monospora]